VDIKARLFAANRMASRAAAWWAIGRINQTEKEEIEDSGNEGTTAVPTTSASWALWSKVLRKQ
jgi:hypothetical protein